MKREYILFFIMLFIGTQGCKKLVEVDSPPTKFDASKAYSTDGNAISVITNIYQEMSNDGFAQGRNSISCFAGVSADELVDYQFDALRTSAYENALSPFNVPFWGRLYYLIYTTNTAIEGISKSNSLSPDVKSRLIGEAKFLRAFMYFYLVNFFGDVPLLLTNDYRINNLAKRSSVEDVYKQIIDDLTESQNLLTSEYLLSDLKTVTEERIRPNKWTAKALLARVYLFINNYRSAEQVSNEIISNTDVFDLQPVEAVFLKGSKEAIWQIQPIDAVWNTYEARTFILTKPPSGFQPVSLSTSLISSFETGDLRSVNWVGKFSEGNLDYYYASKYKSFAENAPITEYLMVFRISEQYLIRAEARANLGDVTGSVADLNTIRTRSRMTSTDVVPNPLPNLVSTLSSDEVLKAVLHERRVELFSEWGHRWFDLRRTGKINDIMSTVAPIKGGVWANYRALYPIPVGDIGVNKNLLQNPGY